ncbi:MAG: hypothetical protein H7839_24050 [Magnetococcus sp. YQC-5]
MTALTVFLSGFASFFSIWQVCILQISPFFMIYLVGISATAQTLQSPPKGSLIGWTLLPSLTYTVGFGAVFALLSAPGLYAGRYLNYHINDLRMASGFYFLLIATGLLLADRLPWLGKHLGPWLINGLTLGTGIALALIYSPCITPTLSQILGLAAHTTTARQGAWLALFYGLGMSYGFALVGTLLVAGLHAWAGWLRQARLIKDLAAGVLLILAGMNITGVMTYYKAFFLGLLVK